MLTLAIDAKSLSDNESYWVYNGLDCMVTMELLEALLPQLDETTRLTYARAMDIQAPALEMMFRGIKLNRRICDLRVEVLRKQQQRLLDIITRFAWAIWERPLNPASPKQLEEFFYSFIGIPVIKERKAGNVWGPSTSREALEKMCDHLYVAPICRAILGWRDCAKKINVLTTEIDEDSRIRCSYGVAATTTGRFASRTSAFATGTNLQNITGELRDAFEASAGKKMTYIDLEQAESRLVGLLAWLCTGKSNYLDACESGDLHTTVCRMTWTDLGWNGEKKHDRAIADRIFYRSYSYRDLAKRAGHGCLTEDHEVLTRNGWVKISEKPEEILTWSEHKSEFSKVSNWVDKPYTGKLIEFNTTSLSLLATADHRVYFKSDQRFPTKVAPAINLPANGYIPLGSDYAGGQESMTVQLAKLIAAFQCDGHQKSAGVWEFHLYKERKILRLQQLAADCGLDVEIRPDSRFIIRGLKFEKDAGPYLLEWPATALIAYINEHQFWDGHVAATSTSISSKNKQHLEWLQTIGRLVGVGGNIQKPVQSGYGTTMYKLQQNNRQYATISTMKRNISEVSNVRVFCPTVPSGAFYVRRNGKISVTGNSNYFGKPPTIAKHTKIPTSLAREFQFRYFQAFPEIPEWHEWVRSQLQTTGTLTSVMGRRRNFFDRLTDDSTLRAAIAYSPQSAIGDILNLGMFQIWQKFPGVVDLLAQIHDAILGEYPEDLEDHIVPQMLQAIRVPLTITHPQTGQVREFSIPSDCMTGWNWGYARSLEDIREDYLKQISKGISRPRLIAFNPNGLKKYKPGTSDTRTFMPLDEQLAIERKLWKELDYNPKW